MVFLPRSCIAGLAFSCALSFEKVPRRATMLQKYVHIGKLADSCPLLKRVSPFGIKTAFYLHFMQSRGGRPKAGNGRVRTQSVLLPPPNRRQAGMKPFHRFQAPQKDSTQRSASPWRRPTGIGKPRRLRRFQTGSGWESTVRKYGRPASGPPANEAPLPSRRRQSPSTRANGP